MNNNEISKLEGYANSRLGLAIRSALAGIPLVGSSASVLVENEIARKRADRIDRFIEEMGNLEQRVHAMESGLSNPSEALLEYAIESAANSFDGTRAAMIARLAFLLREHDPSEVLRRFLIELARNLTNYEIAILLSLSDEIPDSHDTEFRDYLSSMQSRTDSIELIHDVAYQRLSRYGLVAEVAGRFELSELGNELVRAI